MIQIRAGLFETNSSSVHSLVLCNREDYNAWLDEEKLLNLYYNEDWAWKHWDSDKRQYVDTTKGMPPQFVTSEQAAFYDEYYPYPEMEENTWGYNSEFQDAEGNYHERKFMTKEEYDKTYEWDFETFADSYITPGGEEVIAFGYFGHD